MLMTRGFGLASRCPGGRAMKSHATARESLCAVGVRDARSVERGALDCKRNRQRHGGVATPAARDPGMGYTSTYLESVATEAQRRESREAPTARRGRR